ncbi:4Fe-4S binding protein [Lutibacter sp.]
MKQLIKIKKYIDNSNVSRFRFWIQLISFFIFVYGGYFFIEIGSRLPLFSCPYVPGSPGGCYLVGAQHELNTSWSTLFSPRGISILKSLGIFFIFFIFLNKAWCGFVCPLGTLQDWITRLRKSLGLSFVRYNEMSFKKLKSIKYFILVLLILIPLAINNSFFGLPELPHGMHTPFCQICPARIILPLFNGDTSQIFIDFTNPSRLILTSLGLIIAALFLVGSFVKKRFFCFFCPMSALQFLFSKIGILRLIKDGDKCTRCGNCSRVCDIGITAIADDVLSKNIVKDDCMMCFKCVEVCPEEDALKVKVVTIDILSATEEGFFKRYGTADNSEHLKKDNLLNSNKKEDE